MKTIDNKYLKIFFFIFIVALGFLGIKNYYFPIVTMDDISYWTTAKYLSGGEIGEVLAKSSYYSYGYSVLITPLVAIVKNPVILIRTIIIFNFVLIALAFLVTDLSMKALFPSIDKNIVTIITFVSYLYVSNISYSRYMMTESLLVFLFSIVVYLLISINNKPTHIKCVLLATISVYMYYTHLRTVGVFLSAVFVLFVLFIKKKISLSHLLAFCAVLIVLFAIGNMVKNLVADTVFYEIQSSDDINNYSHNASKLSILLSQEGIIRFAVDWLCKIFYLNYATCFVGGLSILYCLKCLFEKNEKILKDKIWSLFIILCFVSTFSIAVIFFIEGDNPARFETVVYGRYIEFIFSPLIAYGILLIMSYKEKMIFVAIVNFFVSIIGLGLVIYRFDKAGMQYSGSSLSAATHYMFAVYKDLDKGIILIFRLLFVMAVIFFFSICRPNLKSMVVLLLGLTCFFSINIWAYEKDNKSNKTTYDNQLCAVVQALNENDTQEVKCVIREFDRNNFARVMQFLCPDKKFEYLLNDDDICSGDVLLVLSDRFYSDLNESGCNYTVLEKTDLLGVVSIDEVVE